MEVEYSQELLDMLQPGNTVRVFYNEGNINNQIRYIRAIVDEEYVVYRVWNKYKRDWFYSVRWIYEFYLLFEKYQLNTMRREISE